jgi:hypothetical protein
MIRSLRQWIVGHGPTERPHRTAPRRRHARPSIEGLEGRQLLTVTYHGGAVLPNVEVQALYYGSDWYTNPTYYSQTGYLEGFLNNIVHGSYMDMLNQDGYGVGRGSFDGGKISLANVDKSQDLTDSQLQSTLQAYIDDGVLKAPDSNRLYVIYVEDNVAVSAFGENSQTGFLGYHGAFAGTDASGHAADIHYAVITYPGGSVGNASLSWTSALGQLTEVTSHELAESVTDPNVNYKSLTWYDDSQNGEIGDIVNGQTVYLNGYAVQRIADRNDQAMTPAGATAQTQESFVLQTNGNLYKVTGSGPTFLASGIASLSDQSIDDHGQVMVDVVTTGGYAYEYHEGSGWTYLWSGATSAKADQGVSYVLFNNGVVDEYHDSSGGWTFIESSVASIDAGTDKIGVNMVDVIMSYGQAWEYSDSSGWHYIASGVSSVSAGQQGISDFVTTSGNAYWFNEASGALSFLGSNVASVTTGTDQYGNYMIDLLFNGGNLWEYRVGSGWTFLDGGVNSIAKGHAGFVDMVFTWGDAWGHDSSGWYYLTGSAQTAS